MELIESSRTYRILNSGFGFNLLSNWGDRYDY